jgi:Flp pilus assembly protein CpaB
MGGVPVAVASQDFQPDQPATAQNVSVAKLPKGALQPDSVGDPMRLAGMAAKGFIPAGTPLRMSMFAETPKAGPAARLSPGMVALALQADGAAGLRQESRVEVWLLGRGKDGPVAQMAAASARVLQPPGEGKSLVLEVSPQEREALLRGLAAGLKAYVVALPPGR